jgi:hypothetical protein
MNELMNHLDPKTYWGLFHNEVSNYVIRFMYTALGSAVHDKADKLVIKSNGFEWYSNDKLLGTFAGGDYRDPTVSYVEILRLILTRDPYLSRYLAVASETSTEAVVQMSIEVE